MTGRQHQAILGAVGIALFAALFAFSVGCGNLPGRGLGAASHGDIRLISTGEEVALEDHLTPGKITLFDFYADWCPPCWEVEPDLERLAADTTNVAVRKINIVDWTTPVVAQHGVTSLPWFVLLDADGQVLAAGDSALQRAFELAR